MCFFDFIKEDLQAACDYQRSLKEEWKNKSNEALVKLLPLKTWKRTVRRVYLPAEEQSARLNKWFEDYILNETAFVDTSVAGQARPLVRGGAEGRKRFQKVFEDQLVLVHKGMLSGEWCAVQLAKDWAGFGSNCAMLCCTVLVLCCVVLCCARMGWVLFQGCGQANKQAFVCEGG